MINKTLLYNNIKNDIHDEELRTLYLSIAKKINRNVNIHNINDNINKVLLLPEFSFLNYDEADHIGCVFFCYILDLLI